MLQSCPTLCDPMDYSREGSSVHGILQARIMEWIALFSRGSFKPSDRTHVSCVSCVEGFHFYIYISSAWSVYTQGRGSGERLKVEQQTGKKEMPLHRPVHEEWICLAQTLETKKVLLPPVQPAELCCGWIYIFFFLRYLDKGFQNSFSLFVNFPLYYYSLSHFHENYWPWPVVFKPCCTQGIFAKHRLLGLHPKYWTGISRKERHPVRLGNPISHPLCGFSINIKYSYNLNRVLFPFSPYH